MALRLDPSILLLSAALVALTLSLILLGAMVIIPLWCNEERRENVHKRYVWIFPARKTASPQPASRFFVKLPVNKARYVEYWRRPRELNPCCFDTYVTPSLPEIQLLADKLLHLGKARGYQAYEQLCLTLAFVQQSIRYVSDGFSRDKQLIEYPKYPIETLMEQKGDCEDQAILAASLLNYMGYEVALLILPTHVALGIAGFNNLRGSYVIDPITGTRYFYTEMTVNGWLPGEMPQEFQADLAQGRYEVLPIAIPPGRQDSHRRS
jgi:predicted transglutaminase-like cysteine proteinase